MIPGLVLMIGVLIDPKLGFVGVERVEELEKRDGFVDVNSIGGGLAPLMEFFMILLTSEWKLFVPGAEVTRDVISNASAGFMKGPPCGVM